ncbi:MAG: EF-hand domain-containing protein [Actinobacteria bacterium]|nr:EF-hand domain-containing protein [Actinomycetota bacterium]
MQNIVDRIFDKYDRDHNNMLEATELRILLAEIAGIQDELLIQQFFSSVDSNGDGRLSKEELTSIFRKTLQVMT